MKVLYIIQIKKIDVTPTKKIKNKTIVIVGESIVQNVSSRSLNQSLKEYFSVVKSFPGTTIQDMNDYIKTRRSTIQERKKVHKELQEKCTAENFAFILYKNINSK